MVEKLIGWEASMRPCPFMMLTLADGGPSVRIAGKAMMNPLVVAISLQEHSSSEERGMWQGQCSDAPDSREGRWLLPTYEGVGGTEARREEQELSLGSCGDRGRSVCCVTISLF